MSKSRNGKHRKQAKRQNRDVLALRRAMLIKTHRNGIVGAEKKRALMGDAWADGQIAYRKAKLKELGAS